MIAITGPGVYALSEPFDFDAIDHKAVYELKHWALGNWELLNTCPKPAGKQKVSITVWGDPNYRPESRLFVKEQLRDLDLAPNPWHLIAFAIMEPDFTAKSSIATQWQDDDGGFCEVTFGIERGNQVAYAGRASDRVYNFWFSGSPVEPAQGA